MGKQMNTTVINLAIENYIPQGATGHLAKSLRERVTKEAKGIKCEVKSTVDYSKKVHDTPMRHAFYPSMGKGFMDLGTGDTNKKRYETGYEAKKDSSPKYPTEFLFKPVNFIKSNLNLFKDFISKAFPKKGGKQ
jgi:hypothetical protein